MYADCVDAVGGRIVTVRAAAGVRVSARGNARGASRRRRAWCSSPARATRPGVLIARDDIRDAGARASRAEALVFVDEAYAEFTDEHFLGELDAHPNVVVGRTFAKAQGLAGLRVGAVVGVPETIARLRRVAAALQHQRRRRGRARSPRSATARTSTCYRAQVARSREIVYAACRRLGLALLAQRRELRAGPRRRRGAGHRRGAARTRHLRPRSLDRSRAAPAASASPTGIVAHTEACAARARGGPVRRAVIDRKTTETQILLKLGIEGQGALPGADRHPLPRSHARAVRAARRVRSRRSTRAATSTSISITRSRTSASRSARRCRRRSAIAAASTAPATSSCRWTRRWRWPPSISAAARTPSST